MKHRILIFHLFAVNSLIFGALATGPDMVCRAATNAISLSLSSNDSVPSDTSASKVKVHQLQELVVKSKNAWLEDGKAVFIPQKRQKNLANDIPSLIRNLATPLLKVNNGTITTLSGQPVNIFINGIPADQLDQSTFWPKNAQRIEYIEMPTDPQFQGKSNVLNFIMKDYQAGGLTKLEARQTIPNEGAYRASSKLVFGKMTYNLLLKGGYSRDHISRSESVEEYRDIWYNDTHHDLVTRSEEASTFTRNNQFYGGFNARYRHKKFTMTHSVGVQWNEDPGSGANASLQYNPTIISSRTAASSTNARSLSPKVLGNYYYGVGSKLGFGGSWSFSHSHNNGFNGYSEEGLDDIITRMRENMYNYRLVLSANYSPSNKIFLQGYFFENFRQFDMTYSGNTKSCQRQRNNNADILLELWYTPNSKWRFTFKPQASLFHRKVNDNFRKNEFVPGIESNVHWSVNPKIWLSAFLGYHMTSPEASERNELILQQTELKWIEGNPSVRPGDSYFTNLTFFWMPSGIFSTSLTPRLSIDTNRSALLYRSGGSAYNGVIGQYFNSPRYTETGLKWNVSLSLCDDKLWLENELSYARHSARFFPRLNSLHNTASINGTFGNCRVGLWYRTPYFELTNGGLTKLKNPAQYDLDFTYGNGNIYLVISFMNIFSRMRHTDSWYLSSEAFQSYNRLRAVGRSAAISISYTFDYGKKVDRSININSDEIRSSSALGSK